MTADEKQKLTTALDVGGPLPWPQSIQEEILLEERRLAAEAHGPSRMRKSGEVSKVLQLLDEIGKEGNK